MIRGFGSCVRVQSNRVRLGYHTVKRSFQPGWLGIWKWLHYCESTDSVFCHTCVKAFKELKMSSRNYDEAFTTKGFHNWKNATCVFRDHETSSCHREAVEKILTLPAKTRDIGDSLSSAHEREKHDNGQCLLKIISNLRFLARQSCALRGDGDESASNFIQLLRLRGEDDPKVIDWMKKRANEYTSPEMQNDLIKIMAVKVLRGVSDRLRTSPFYAIMADETTDSANKEQVVVVLRWVDTKDFSVHEDFIGLYEVASTRSDTLVSVIKDTLCRLNLPVAKCRGQCYDGASNMSGIRNGVASQIRREESRAIYTHCYGHSLNLATVDAIKKFQVNEVFSGHDPRNHQAD